MIVYFIIPRQKIHYQWMLIQGQEKFYIAVALQRLIAPQRPRSALRVGTTNIWISTAGYCCNLHVYQVDDAVRLPIVVHLC